MSTPTATIASLSGVTVWLSGAVPEPDTWGDRPLDMEVLDFVALLSALVLKQGGEILHGAHPSFTAVLLEQARRFAKAGFGRDRVTLAVSKFWERETEAEISEWKAFCRIIETECGADDAGKPDREASLARLRARMAEEAHAFVALGGKWWSAEPGRAGVPRGFELARERGLPCFLIGGFGGKSAGYLREHPHLLETLNNGLSADENRELAACADLGRAAGRVVSQLRALFERKAEEDNLSVMPAHALYVELATRITTQRLHYRSGDEETAAKSVASLFETTRKFMTQHPAAHRFHEVALQLLNGTLRPYTARWHGWMTRDGDKVDNDGNPVRKFRDEWVRRSFREELRELQPRLFGFQKAFLALSRGKEPDHPWLHVDEHEDLRAQFVHACNESSRTAHLGDDLPLAMRPQVTLRRAGAEGRVEASTIAREIEHAERQAIQERRAQMHLSADGNGQPLRLDDPVDNPTGLALSGGGIRSATFCLGIVQALHRCGLFTQFDYLSTVSGGGYFGSFISCYLGAKPPRVNAVEQRISEKRNTPLEHTTQLVDTARPPDDETRKAGGKEACERINEAFRVSETGGSESPAIRHLRNNSRYLLNGGGRGLLRIAGVFITGFFTSLLMLLTLPLLAAWVLLGIKQPGVARFFEAHFWLLEPWRDWNFGGTVAVFAMAGSWLALSGKVKGWEATAAIGLGTAGIVIWVVALVRFLGLAAVYPPGLALPSAWHHPAGIALAGVLSLQVIVWLLMPLAQRFGHGT